MVQYYILDEKKEHKDVKHLGRIGLIITNFLISIVGWGILWWLIYCTTQTSDNRVTINTNKYGEMWPEFVMGLIFMFFIGGFFIYSLKRETKIK